MSSKELTLAIGIGLFSGALTLSGLSKVKTLLKLLNLVRENNYMPIQEIQKQRDTLSTKEVFFISGTLQRTKFYDSDKNKNESSMLECALTYNLFSNYEVDKKGSQIKVNWISAIEVEDHEVPTQRLKMSGMLYSSLVDLSMITKESPSMLSLSKGRRVLNSFKNGIAYILSLLTGFSFRGSIIGTSEHTLTLMVGTPIFTIAKIEPKSVFLIPSITSIGPITSSITKLQDYIESKVLINSITVVIGLAGIAFSLSIIARKLMSNFPHIKATYTQDKLRKKKSKEFEEAPDNLRCIVCLDQLKNYLFFPCHHCSMCVTCGDRFFGENKKRKCPICKIPVNGERLINYS